MTKERQIVITLWALLLAIATAPAARAQDAFQKFAESAAISAEGSAAIVVDLANGKVVGSHNDMKPLIPASIMKALTTATLLEKTGTDYRYVTPVYIDGSILGGVLQGNLIIHGTGDPSINACAKDLTTTDFVQECVQAVKKADITSINGRILVDEAIFEGPAVPPSWQSGDLSKYYGTGSHGFNFESNSSGNASVANPAEVFRTRLTTALRNAGVEVAGQQTGGNIPRLLFSHVSPPMDEIMRSCMMRSDNLFAECLLRTLALESDLPASTQEAAALETKIWKEKGMDMRGVNIVDGSGLSRQNRLTAKFLAQVLQEMSDDPYYASFFPLAGQEGTLKKFLRDTPLDSYIAMKTGSMKGIQCYAGYKLDEDYVPTHAVVIILNDFKNRDEARNATATLLMDIFFPQENAEEECAATEE